MKRIFMGESGNQIAVLVVNTEGTIVAYTGTDIGDLKELANTNEKHAMIGAISQLLAAARAGQL